MSRASTASSRFSTSSIQDQDIPGSFPEDDTASVVSSQKTLSEALYARRAEYARPHTVRIKVGSWNVAGKKGTEHDVAGWFVGGKGVSEALTGLSPTSFAPSHHENEVEDHKPEGDSREGVGEQERRRSKKTSTIPKGDPGEVPGGEEVEIYVLGLQEIVDISSASETLRPYSDPTASKRWRKELEAALPRGYQLVAEQQLIGLLLLIYTSPEVTPHISSVSTTSIGTGLMGYMGNKGAVTARIVLGETTRLVFVNSHLSSGLGKAELDRRNWDAAQILNRTRFEPIVDSLGYVADRGEKIGDEDFTFWFGDLNYRLEGIPGDDVRRLLMLHTRNEYDIGQRSERKIESEISASTEVLTLQHPDEKSPASSPASSFSSATHTIGSRDEAHSITPSSQIMESIDESLDPSADPTSLQTTLDSLLPHDELRQQMKSRKIFHDGWKEGPITFLPTYKYDVGSVGLLDSSEKRRAPSWCDRILYRTRKTKTDYENMMVEEEHAKKRDDDMKAQGVDKAAADEDMLFEYDPEADGDDDLKTDAVVNATGAAPMTVTTKDGFEDVIGLEYYISHQRVLSSDHKPLDAIFKLEYDAAIPELKSKIHQEVARDLDRAENEGRPAVTLVVDGRLDGKDPDFGGVSFGDLRYEERKLRSFTVANTGRVRAEFGLVARPVGRQHTMSPTPPWLCARVELATEDSDGGASKVDTRTKGSGWSEDVPMAFSLEPGNASSVKLTAEVSDTSFVKALNEGTESLEDVLILRVRDGRDHFLPVRASWQQSIYGRTVDALTRIPEGGVRKLQHQRPKGLSSKQLTDENAVKFSVPPAFHRLTEAIEALTERMVSEWSMKHDPSSTEEERPPWMEHAGWPFSPESRPPEDEERRKIRLMVDESLDTDQSLDQALPPDVQPRLKNEVLSEVLVRLSASLEDGIINGDLWSNIEADYFGSDRSIAKSNLSYEDKRAAVLEIFSSSSHRSASFIIITAMLNRIAQEIATSVPDSSVNGGSLKRTGSILASTRFPGRRKTTTADARMQTRQSINRSFAEVFAEVLIRSPNQQEQRAKPGRGTTVQDDRKKQLLELFIDNNI